MYTTAEPTSPESLKSALSLGQMSLQPLVPFVGSRRGGNSRDILSSPSVNRNTENLCICLSPRLWWELGYTPEMLRSKQCVRNSINLTAAGKKSSVHLQIEILGLVICPQAGEGHREGWGALGLPKGTNPHWLLYRDFPMFKSLITENWSTKIYLQGLFSKKKTISSCIFECYPFTAAQGLKSGHIRGIPQWSKGKHTSEQLVC